MNDMNRLLQLVLVGLCFISGSAVYAQDIIITKDDNIIRAIVTEISSSEIVYKRFDNPDGPNYRTAVSDVKKIRYQNGKEETFTSAPSASSISSEVQSEETTAQNPANAGNIGRIKKEFYRMAYASYKAVYPNKYKSDSGWGLDVATDVHRRWGLLMTSSIFGWMNRGWETSGDQSWFSADAIMYSYRFGLDLPMGSMDDYFGVVWGPYISYDLWGSGKANGKSFRIRDVDGYERLDVGWSLDLDFVFGNYMIFFSWWNGWVSMSNYDTMKHRSFTIGIGYSF